jgi:hypothetical protein
MACLICIGPGGLGGHRPILEQGFQKQLRVFQGGTSFVALVRFNVGEQRTRSTLERFAP